MYYEKRDNSMRVDARYAMLVNTISRKREGNCEKPETSCIDELIYTPLFVVDDKLLESGWLCE